MVTQRAAGLQQVRVHLAQHSNLSCLLSFSFLLLIVLFLFPVIHFLVAST